MLLSALILSTAQIGTGPTMARPIPKVALSSAATPPRERMPAQRYVTPDDYPAAALGTGAQGVVEFNLTIDPIGRITDCVISRSSGSSVLDEATCNIIHRRARYTPARDANGHPVVGKIAQRVEWKAPR